MAEDVREPTEDELIDFMDWLIDHKGPDDEIDMSNLLVTGEPLASFSEDRLGPPTGEEPLTEATDGAAAPICRWWDGRIYVVDLGDVRLVYEPD